MQIYTALFVHGPSPPLSDPTSLRHISLHLFIFVCSLGFKARKQKSIGGKRRLRRVERAVDASDGENSGRRVATMGKEEEESTMYHSLKS